MFGAQLALTDPGGPKLGAKIGTSPEKSPSDFWRKRTTVSIWRTRFSNTFSQPNKKRFSIRRIIGGGDLWVTEFILTYDGKPSYTVSIMEFRGEKVARETQYFPDPFVAPASRAQWVERMDT